MGTTDTGGAVAEMETAFTWLAS